MASSLDGLKKLFWTRVKMSSGVHFGGKVAVPKLENEARPVFHNSRLTYGRVPEDQSIAYATSRYLGGVLLYTFGTKFGRTVKFCNTKKYGEN